MGLSWLGATQTELISKQIADQSPQGEQQSDFIQAMITEFEGSAEYKFMSVAQRYYENDPDIREKKRIVEVSSSCYTIEYSCVNISH